MPEPKIETESTIFDTVPELEDFRNKEQITNRAKEVFDLVKDKYPTAWDDRGNIGKRYFSQDEIGTPYCVTVDYQTLEDNTVTIRDRDTMQQERIKIDDILKHIA